MSKSRFRLNFTLFIICFLCTVGFTIASIVSKSEIFEIFAVTFSIMTLYEFGYVSGYCGCKVESEE